MNDKDTVRFFAAFLVLMQVKRNKQKMWAELLSYMSQLARNYDTI